jgi:hypothetical protein
MSLTTLRLKNIRRRALCRRLLRLVVFDHFFDTGIEHAEGRYLCESGKPFINQLDSEETMVPSQG